jgi:hypothetical protein
LLLKFSPYLKSRRKSHPSWSGCTHSSQCWPAGVGRRAQWEIHWTWAPSEVALGPGHIRTSLPASAHPLGLEVMTASPGSHSAINLPVAFLHLPLPSPRLPHRGSRKLTSLLACTESWSLCSQGLTQQAWVGHTPHRPKRSGPGPNSWEVTSDLHPLGESGLIKVCLPGSLGYPLVSATSVCSAHLGIACRSGVIQVEGGPFEGMC